MVISYNQKFFILLIFLKIFLLIYIFLGIGKSKQTTNIRFILQRGALVRNSTYEPKASAKIPPNPEQMGYLQKI
jgi:hypothetical protein